MEIYPANSALSVMCSLGSHSVWELNTRQHLCFTYMIFSLLSSFSQVTASVTAGNVNATRVTLVTTVTAPSRHLRAFLTMDGCAAGEAAVRVVAVSAPSRAHSEKPVKNAPHAPMPVVLRGKLSVPYRTLYLRGILSFLLSQRKSHEVLFFHSLLEKL